MEIKPREEGYRSDYRFKSLSRQRQRFPVVAMYATSVDGTTSKIVEAQLFVLVAPDSNLI